MATKEEAKRYLYDTDPEKCFWVNNGHILKNLEELANALADMNDETFRYHANNERNDFSIWVNEVIGDKKLANDLLSSRSRESALKKIKTRLNSLKNTAA